MDSQQAAHFARLRHLREAFASANEHLVGRLRAASDHDAERAHADGWSAAQTAWHVASVNTRFAAVISGDAPAAKPLEPGFTERAWDGVAAEIPDKLQAPASALPPPHVTRHDAIAMLEAAAVKIARAFDTLTPGRGSTLGITHPAVGTINLYQVGDWAAAHIKRHEAQVARALGGQ